MEFLTMNAKGQVVIPKQYRKKYGMKRGSKLGITEDKKGNLVIKAMNKAYFESFAGILKGEGDLIAELMREKAIEREL
jgi:AbrB family looped-hinge helix DNA binding protein